MKKVAAIWVSFIILLSSIVVLDIITDFTPLVEGSTLFVNKTGSGGAFTSIQDAIDAGADGDTVFVYNGTYWENLVIDKSINLTGENREGTKIDGSGIEDVILVLAGRVTISGFTMTNGFNGIHIQSNGNHISNNIITYNRYSGIYLDDSIGHTIKENIMQGDGIFISGSFLENWNTHTIDISNTVDDKPIHYLKNQIGGVVPSGAGQIIIVNCSDMVIKDQELVNGSVGIEIGFCSNINISNNIVSNNDWIGIYLFSSNGNNIMGNNFTSNWGYGGISLEYSNGNKILGNNVSLNTGGISFYLSNENNITFNTVCSNTYDGIILNGSHENSIYMNNVSKNNWGFDVLLSNRNIIGDNKISNNNYEGIYSRRSSGLKIMGNIILSNKYTGIFLGESTSYTLLNNTMRENSIFISGTSLEHYNSHYIDTSNTVNGKQVYYWKNRTGGFIPTGAGEVILANCTNVKIKNQEIPNGTVGIELGYSSNNIIKYNNISSNNLYGIYLDQSINNSITGNNVSSNRLGIGLADSNQNDITLNQIFSNKNIGIYLRDSLNNNIFHNNIMQNTEQAFDDSSNQNLWDNGYPLGGNYWSDYLGLDNYSGPGQNISGGDGIGDTPYIIDSDSSDNYPILTPNEETDSRLPPPMLYIDISPNGKDVILNWDPFPIDDDPYLIFRSTDPTNFNFDRPWINTLTDIRPNEFESVPDRTTWTDTNAADPSNETNYEEQYYYTIRAYIEGGEMSRTSRTVGKWTKTFPKGVSTFSVPLESTESLYVDDLTTDMNADYIKYMDPVNHTWRQHNLGDGEINNTHMKLGEGYEVRFENQNNYTFTGMSAAMISYDDYSGFSGFDTTNEARSLNVSVEENGDVRLSWEEPGSMDFDDRYEIYYSNNRDGFYGNFNSDFFLAASCVYFGNNTAIHINAQANSPGTQLYYMVVPFNETDIRGSSTYSIGIWTQEYLIGYDTFALPLNLGYNPTVDYYVDRIPNTVGINYYSINSQRWCWHSKKMPEGAYDPVLEMTEGYQISTLGNTKFTFMGT